MIDEVSSNRNFILITYVQRKKVIFRHNKIYFNTTLPVPIDLGLMKCFGSVRFAILPAQSTVGGVN